MLASPVVTCTKRFSPSRARLDANVAIDESVRPTEGFSGDAIGPGVTRTRAHPLRRGPRRRRKRQCADERQNLGRVIIPSSRNSTFIEGSFNSIDQPSVEKGALKHIFADFDFRILFAEVGKRAAFRLSASHTGARMEPATPAHDILAATLIALVSIFASVLGISGLKRRARKFAKNAPTKAR
jgi:hypothetical protein